MPRDASPDPGDEDAAAELPPLYDRPRTLATVAATAGPPSQQDPDSNSKERQHGRSSTATIAGSLQRTSMVGKPASTNKASHATQAKPAQQQQVAVAAKAASTEGDEADALPMHLRIGQPKKQMPAPGAWSPSSGEAPSRWLEAAHGPAWQAQAVAAARQAAAANRQLLGQLEQRRAALLRVLGSAQDLDFKRLLQLVQTYSDDVQALLEAGQAAALQQQQQYVQQLTADAAGVVDGSIQSALAAARTTHQQQVTLLQQGEASRLQAARLSAAQQLEATLKLQQQTAQQQLQQETQQLQDSWSGHCRQVQAAAEKQEALRAHGEAECCKLRAELAAAKREAASWRARWEKDCAAYGAPSSSGTAGLGAAAGSASSTGGVAGGA